MKEIVFESKKASVTLTRRTDKRGAYFVGHTDKTVTVGGAKKHPHGGPHGDPHKKDEPEKPAETKKESVDFISVSAAERLTELLAPLKAYRAVGKIDEARAKEFGFDTPQGTVRVTVGGAKHSLTLGGTTPGGADRYARDERGKVFAVPGSIARDLLGADSRLIERKLHDFEPREVTRAVVRLPQGEREVLKIAGQKNAWADPGAPKKKDETVVNWMTKIDRLRAMKYTEKVDGAERLVRVDFYARKRPVGFLELPPRQG